MRTNERDTNILEAGRQKVDWLLILRPEKGSQQGESQFAPQTLENAQEVKCPLKARRAAKPRGVCGMCLKKLDTQMPTRQ